MNTLSTLFLSHSANELNQILDADLLDKKVMRSLQKSSYNNDWVKKLFIEKCNCQDDPLFGSIRHSAFSDKLVEPFTYMVDLHLPKRIEFGFDVPTSEGESINGIDGKVAINYSIRPKTKYQNSKVQYDLNGIDFRLNYHNDYMGGIFNINPNYLEICDEYVLNQGNLYFSYQDDKSLNEIIERFYNSMNNILVLYKKYVEYILSGEYIADLKKFTNDKPNFKTFWFNVPSFENALNMFNYLKKHFNYELSFLEMIAIRCYIIKTQCNIANATEEEIKLRDYCQYASEEVNQVLEKPNIDFIEFVKKISVGS